MGIGQILELLGILIAVIAIISERNRRFIFLKFTRLELLGIVLLFIFINYLIFYPPIRELFTFLRVFEIENFPKASTWAYAFTLGILAFFVYKIFYARFPEENFDKVQKYLLNLLYRGNIELVVSLIEEPYRKNIPAYLRAIRTFEPNLTIEVPFQARDEEYFQQKKRFLLANNLMLEHLIFHTIIVNEHFVSAYANSNPYFFTDIIRELNTRELSNREFIFNYLYVITSQRNSHFRMELFRGDYSVGFNSQYEFGHSSRIMKAFCEDANVASVNLAWRGVADCSISELNEEISKEFSKLRANREYLNLDKEDYLVSWAIQFIDMLVRAAIVQNVNDHMWLFYYRIFSKLLLTNLYKENGLSGYTNRETLTFSILEDMVSNLQDWIDTSMHHENRLSISIVECMGDVIWQIGSTNKLNLETKQYLINWCWREFVFASPLFMESDDELTKEKKNNILLEVRGRAISQFASPSLLYNSTQYDEESERYKRAIEYMFENRDKFDYPDDNPVVEEFRSNVIEKLSD